MYVDGVKKNPRECIAIAKKNPKTQVRRSHAFSITTTHVRCLLGMKVAFFVWGGGGGDCDGGAGGGGVKEVLVEEKEEEEEEVLEVEEEEEEEEGGRGGANL